MSTLLSIDLRANSPLNFSNQKWCVELFENDLHYHTEEDLILYHAVTRMRAWFYKHDHPVLQQLKLLRPEDSAVIGHQFYDCITLGEHMGVQLELLQSIAKESTLGYAKKWAQARAHLKGNL